MQMQRAQGKHKCHRRNFRRDGIRKVKELANLLNNKSLIVDFEHLILCRYNVGIA
jgi:hypothetical protein